MELIKNVKKKLGFTSKVKLIPGNLYLIPNYVAYKIGPQARHGKYHMSDFFVTSGTRSPGKKINQRTLTWELQQSAKNRFIVNPTKEQVYERIITPKDSLDRVQGRFMEFVINKLCN